MDVGSAQEQRLVQHLRSRGFADIVHGEEAVKRTLGLPAGPGYKCADVLGFTPNKIAIQRIVVAESKGTEVSKALKQLGNTAVAVMERYGIHPQLELLLYRSELRNLPAGRAPGPGFLVKARTTPKTFILIDATCEARPVARASCDLTAPWNRWSSGLQRYEIQVFVEQA
jgi:hypothetical protein